MLVTGVQTCALPISVLSKINLQTWLLSVFGIFTFIAGLRAESPVQAMPLDEKIFRVPASRLPNHSQGRLAVDLRHGIGPDDAATIALYSNPALRAIRDRRGWRPRN